TRSRSGWSTRPSSCSASSCTTRAGRCPRAISGRPKATAANDAAAARARTPARAKTARAERAARRPADEILGRVRAARAVVSGDCGIRAERPRAYRLAAHDARRLDALGRRVVAQPAVERRDEIEAVGADAARAVVHAGHHEQAHAVVGE